MSTKLKAGTATSGAVIDADTTGILELQTGSTPTTAVTIDASQNVGIGTSSPSANGKLTLSASGSSNYQTIIAGSNTSLVGTDANGLALSALGANNIVCYTVGAERMRIDSSGNLLVGTTTGSGATGKTTSVSFAGFNPGTNITGAAFSAIGSYGGGFASVDGTQGYVMWSQNSGADFYIRRATTTTGVTGGVYISNAAGSWSAASDERLKNIIRPIENAVEKLKDYRCVIGEYKDNEGAERPFLIAQDVEKTFPEAVNVMDKENGYLGLSYTELTPLLVKAIQELNAKVDAQAAEIASLKGAK